jgi:primosomal protein N' (replication factor Y) (superfamily II helicase)
MASLFEEFDEPAAPAPVSQGKRVPILMPVALDQTYDYLLPDDFNPVPGQFVLVPFGPQHRVGIVWDKPIGGDASKAIDPSKMKAVAEILHEVPPLPLMTLRFTEWIAKYTLAPLGMVARMMMGASAVFEPLKPRFGVKTVPGASHPPRMTPARTKALDIASDGLVRSKSALAEASGCSSGVIDGLVTAGCLVEVAIPEKVYARPDPAHADVAFSDAQHMAVQSLQAAIDGATFSVSLLDGVTGSGKTEVYFEAVAFALKKGAQVA